MGFGPAPRDPLADVAEIIAAAEDIAAELARVRLVLRSTGLPLAAMYVEGAIDALSVAMDAAIDGCARQDPRAGALAIGVLDVRLRPSGTHPYASVDRVDAVRAPAGASLSLGAAMLAEPAISDRLRSDELAAALMSAALSHSDWIHLPTDVVVHGDAMAARAVVSTVAGRDTFPAWTRNQMGGLIDRASADLLAGIGWRRMTGAALPGAG